MTQFKEDQKPLPTTFQSSADAQGHLGLMKKCDRLWSHCFCGLSLPEDQSSGLCAGARASRLYCSTHQSEGIVPAAHHHEWQACTSAPKICKSYWHSSSSPHKPDRVWAALSYFQLFGCPVRSPRQLPSPLHPTVRLYWWTSGKCTEMPLSVL